jgi:hypothetical protein
VFLCVTSFNFSKLCAPLIQWHLYEGVSKSFRIESITKYTLITINARWEATQRVMAAKVSRLTHKIAIELHLVAESCTICSSRSDRLVRKLLDTLVWRRLFTVRTIQAVRYPQIDTHRVYTRSAQLFCCAVNIGKIWSICGQHEIQYIISGMCKYTYNYMCTRF